MTCACARSAVYSRFALLPMEQRSQRHSKENQDLCQMKEVVERRHHKKKKDFGKREKEKMELGRGCLGEGRA